VKRPRAALVALLAIGDAWMAAPAIPAAAATGQVAYDGCVADTAAHGCFDLPGAPLDGAASVTASPDGKSVYVAALDGSSAAHFSCELAARGPVRVLVANANAFAVTGTVAGTATMRTRRGVHKLIARRFSVAAGSRTTLGLALPKALRRELQRKRKLAVRLSVAVQDPAGNRRTIRREVTPRLKAPRRAASPCARRPA
jgi:hypothetical protein